MNFVFWYKLIIILSFTSSFASKILHYEISIQLKLYDEYDEQPGIVENNISIFHFLRLKSTLFYLITLAWSLDGNKLLIFYGLYFLKLEKVQSRFLHPWHCQFNTIGVINKSSTARRRWSSFSLRKLKVHYFH